MAALLEVPNVEAVTRELAGGIIGPARNETTRLL
jgi:hypothetical protein